MTLWSTCFAMAVVALLFVFGNFISYKTRAYVSSVLVAVIVFVILMYSGIVPPDVCATAGLTGMVATFVIPFCIIDVATKMKLNELKSEWKTVLTVIVATLGIVAICVLVGIPLIGKAKAIGAIGPLSGALLATTISQQMAVSMNAPDVAVFVMIVLILQMLVALPVATVCLKKYIKQIRGNGQLSEYMQKSGVALTAETAGASSQKPVKKNIFATPKSLDSEYTIFFKIALIGFIGYAVGTWLAGPTKNVMNPTLGYLFFGVFAAEIGFLERGPLEKAHSNGIIYFALFSLLLSTFASVSFEVMVAQIVPAISIILMAAVGILVFTALFSRVIRVSPWMSMAIGMCCYLGYPCSQIVVEETVRSAGLTPEEAKACNSMIIPRMILGYFIAAIISILSASIAVAYMF
ncbi:MAG: hypothetical protein EOM54_03065 [Clostridia bacterium]|nr:hypothetical protein [Clostridia bacterium]